MKRSIFSLALAATMLVAAPVAHATLIQPVRQSVRPRTRFLRIATSGTGTATLVLDTTAQTLEGHIVFSGLNPLTPGGAPSGTTAAHIHCCLPSAFATGVNVGVATRSCPPFPGFPLASASLSGIGRLPCWI